MLGRKIPFDLLAAVTGLAEDDLIGVLRELVAPRAAGRGGRRRVQFPARAGPRGGRRPVARPASGAACTSWRSRRSPPAATPTSRWSPTTPRGAGRYDDLVVAAAPRRADVISGMGSPYQALQLAEMGLDEVPDDAELLAVRGPGGLAGRPARRRRALRPDWLARRPPPASGRRRCACWSGWRGRAAARDEMARAHRPSSATAIQELPEPASGPRRWRDRPVVTCCATSPSRPCAGPTAPSPWPTSWTCRRSGSPRWSRRAPRWSATAGAASTQGRALLREVAGEAEEAGEWLLGRAGAQQPAQHVPSPLLDRRAARPARTHAHRRRARPASSRSPSPPTSRAGPAWRCRTAT